MRLTSKHTMNMLDRRIVTNLIVSAISAVALLTTPCLAADEVYGPQNLLKSMKTPFGFTEQKSQNSNDQFRPMTIQSGLSHSLSNRLLPPRLYLPGRMVIGQTAEFIIKGHPGSWAALAMADRDSGAKPLYGHDIRLGPDRKVVSLGQIPEGGVLSLAIDTPIQGDLIGQQLFFEAVLWTKPDFSDLEVASSVPSETSTGGASAGKVNGVTIAGEPEHKRGVRIVPDGFVPAQQKIPTTPRLDSGRP